MFRNQLNDPSQAIILAGSGRSGTTWLGNIIAANPNIRTIFEPFDYRRSPEAVGMPLRPYGRADEEYPWGPFIEQVLCGDIQNAWVNRQGNRWWAWRRLIKTIRTTLLLSWIDKHFRPSIVFVTRHPCAVVLSRLKLKWETHLDVFLSQPQLMADYLEPFRDLISSAESEAEKQAVMWCVENYVPLRQLSEHNWIFCTYELFYRQTQSEADRVLQGLGLRKSWFTQRAIQKATIVTRPDSAILHEKDPLIAWRQQLSSQEIETILSTVKAFGIGLYNEDPMPNVQAVAPQSMTSVI